MPDRKCLDNLHAETGGKRFQRRPPAATSHRRTGRHRIETCAEKNIAVPVIPDGSLPYWLRRGDDQGCSLLSAPVILRGIGAASADVPDQPMSASFQARAYGLATWQIHKAQTLLAHALDEYCPVSHAAAACRLSKGHFARLFKESVGLPPHRWLTRQRIEAAKTMLRDTDFSLSEIALECGFCEQAHMCRVFRKWLGTTPGAWRKSVVSD